MKGPRLNCYCIDLQLFIRAKHQIPSKGRGQRKSIPYETRLFYLLMRFGQTQLISSIAH